MEAQQVTEPQQVVVPERLPIAAFFIGNVISYVGDVLALLAIPWFVLQTTGFVGTLIFGAIGHRFPRRLTFGVGYAVGGAVRFWILLFSSFPLIVGWSVIAGLAISVVNPLGDTVLQERTPPSMLARVYGTFGALILVAVPLGTFISGFVVAWLGLYLTLALMGALYLLSTLSLLLNPALKEMEDRERGQRSLPM